jgi:4-amino-4-deoxy-L-arabinose transferase-like glycosyltransferase
MSRLFWPVALALLPLLVLALRWASFLPSVIDWDESLYILQAREWLRGNWPLSGVWDMHPVGAPALIAAAFLLLGEQLATVRLLGAFCVAATGYALYALVRVLGAPRSLGYAAALLYAAHSVLLGGLASNTEILFAPFTVSALAVALARGAAWPRLIAAGLLVGLALLVKPVAAPEGCLAFALLAWAPLRARQWRRLGVMALAYAALCAGPTLLVGGLYALRGEFGIWYTSTIEAPLTYALGRVSLEQALWRVTLAALALRWLVLLALIAPPVQLALGARPAQLTLDARPAQLALDPPGGLPGQDPALRRVAGLGLAWFAVAALAIAGPGMFFPHYFLIALPPLSLLAALGAFLLARLATERRSRLLLAASVAAICLDVLAADLAPRLARGFAMGSPDTPRRMAALMNDELLPGDSIFVPNYQPVVYFLARAALPTRFPFPVHLTGSFGSLAGVDTDAEVARILATRPRFIVLDRSEWFTMRASAMAMLTEALEEGYELAASLVEERGAVELWRRVEAE